ncbi:MAG: glycerophosphodiester phosphodiesterase [Acidimicrobiales bacterium]
MTDIYAHRGCAGVPTPRENTIAAFLAAARLGADGVELDVWRTARGELAVHHDRHVPLVGDVTNVPAAQLPSDLPMLAEALDVCVAHGLAVNVEVKCAGDCEPTAAAVAAALEDRPGRPGRPGRLVVSSFDPACLAALRAAGSTVARGLLVDWHEDPEAAARRAVALGCSTLHPFVTQVDGALAGLAGALGLGLHVWTVNADADLEAMARLGVAAVITDRVPAARAVLARVAADEPRNGGGVYG